MKEQEEGQERSVIKLGINMEKVGHNQYDGITELDMQLWEEQKIKYVRIEGKNKEHMDFNEGRDRHLGLVGNPGEQQKSWYNPTPFSEKDWGKGTAIYLKLINRLS